MSLRIRRLSYALGAEVLGVAIDKTLDDKTFSEIHAAFLEHSLLLFRGQALTREDHIAFSGRFGEVDNNDAAPRIRDPECPQIQLIINKPQLHGKLGAFAGELWHSDQSYSQLPAMATLLRGVDIPEIGGDTMFSNMYLAYETLSDVKKGLIEGLHGVHFGGKARIDISSPERAAETTRLNPPVAHPLVRVHPETGRKALFIGEKVKQLVGMTAEESKALIDFLCNHAARPQLCYRHQWRQDDLLVWDNRCTLHRALGDYDKSQRRHIERTTVIGTPSGYPYEGPSSYGGPRL